MNWGPWTAGIYALLMAAGHFLQVRRNHREKRVGMDSLYLVTILGAVIVRLSTVGVIFFQTQSLTALLLATADVSVLLGFGIIIGQAVKYRRPKNQK